MAPPEAQPAPATAQAAAASPEAEAPESEPAPRAPEAAPRRRAPSNFSAERAWQHLRALVEIGPRVSGSEGSARAREYILEQLAALGVQRARQTVSYAQGEDAEPLEIVNLGAVIPGESSDLIVLVAPYDTRPFEDFRFVGANAGGSGAAVLLELARVLSEDPLPYTTWLIFLDGESSPVKPPRRTRPGYLGSYAAANHFQRLGHYRHVRLLVALDRVCDADLRIARDLRSHRIYREEFWYVARHIGRGEAFADGGFESVMMSHVPFIENRLRRVVAITDTSFGGDEPPGVYADSEDDSLEHCSPESLETVGAVTLEALRVLAPRLAKIDRFVDVEGGEPGELFVEPEPEPEEAAEASEGESPEETAEEAAETPEGEAAEGAEAAATEAEAPAADGGEPGPMPEATPEPTSTPAPTATPTPTPSPERASDAATRPEAEPEPGPQPEAREPAAP